MSQTKVRFILGYTTFIFFVTNITAMFAAGSITSGSSGLPPPPTGNVILNIFNNLGWFIGLSSVNSSYAMLNLLIFAPLAVALIWAIGELIAEAIP